MLDVAGLVLERNAPVGSIVIDRADRSNAFTREMWEALPRLIDELESDSDVRVLVLESAVDGVFSAGADVWQMHRDVKDAPAAADHLRAIDRAFARLATCELPTVAVLDGACHGGGIGLALCADIRLGTTRSRISIPSARLGVVFPYPALERLLWTVGTGNARLLLLTGRAVDATEAHRIGLLDLLVEPPELSASRDRIAGELATASPYSVKSTKQTMAGIEIADPDVISFADRLQAGAVVGSDHLEGVTSFIEKRPPRFRRS